MAQAISQRQKKAMDPLLKNQLIGGICAGLVVLLACIRIFVLHASTDGIMMNLMSVANAVLSLVVLTSAVRIMISAKRAKSFEEVLSERCEEISRQYGALIEIDQGNEGTDDYDKVYLIADNLDAIFTPSRDDWTSLNYLEKFAFSHNFVETRKIYFYVNNVNMKARAERLGDDLETTARLLARDTAVAIQRSFSDILTAHALEITQESGRSIVTIDVISTTTVEDAERIAMLIEYMLFLHFVAT